MIPFESLSWDSDFFGLNICKIEVTDYSEIAIRSSVDSALAGGYELIYLIIPEEIDKLNIFKDELIDSKVIYEKNLVSEKNDFHNIKDFNEELIPDKLYEIALESGKYSRFKIDSRFPEGGFEKLYRKWIENSVTHEIADKVFICLIDDKITGLSTLKRKENSGEIGIIAADQRFQGQGIGTKLLKKCENYLEINNCSKIEVATQRKNTSACKFYEKNGYKVKKVLNYYHIWKRK